MPPRQTTDPTRREPPTDPPPSDSYPPPTPDREKVLRELAAAEARGKAALDRAIADLSGVYEKQLGERDARIRDLQNQLLQATAADGSINASLVQLRAEMAAIALRVNKEQAPAQLEAATTAAKSETNTTTLKSVLAAIASSGILTTLIVALAQSCGDAPKKEPPKLELKQTAPQPNPANLGGRP